MLQSCPAEAARATSDALDREAKPLCWPVFCLCAAHELTSDDSKNQLFQSQWLGMVTGGCLKFGLHGNERLQWGADGSSMNLEQFVEDFWDGAFEESGVVVDELCEAAFVNGSGHLPEDGALDEVARAEDRCQAVHTNLSGFGDLELGCMVQAGLAELAGLGG